MTVLLIPNVLLGIGLFFLLGSMLLRVTGTKWITFPLFKAIPFLSGLYLLLLSLKLKGWI
jgi:hypothetical protein